LGGFTTAEGRKASLCATPRSLLLPIQTQIKLFVIIEHGNPEPIQEADTP
jgi:hypothetical protein